ncbi:MAG: hypothetical protein H0T51_03645 [Pirellulales bacterium]|nr:hypothetical protein [Pirellulales bacterium]
MIGAAVCAALVAAPIASFGAVKSWNTGIGNWSAGGNWSPAGVPAAGDVVNIGAHAAAENAAVSLTAVGSVASVALTDGMTLRTLTGSLGVNGSTQISGQNIVGLTTYSSTLRIENGAAPHDFSTVGLTAGQFARVTLEDDAALIISGAASFADDAELSGRGTVTFTGAAARVLSNDGLIYAGVGGLTLHQSGVGELDLDGDNGNGTVVADVTGGTTLTVTGTELADAFSGDIQIGPNSILDMDFANGWTADSSSSITVTAAAAMLPPAYLDGGDVVLAGDVSVTGVAGRLRVLANATLNSTLAVTVGTGDQLAFDDEAQINGGDFNVGSDGLLSFWGETTVENGVFNTAGTGQVSFNGLTTWNGGVTFNGRAEQNGDATVSGTTTINADQFDMDGSAASPTERDVNAGLVINADQVGATAANSFAGVFNIGGGLFNRLTINLTNPVDAWVMSGEMNFSGVAGLYFTRVGGSRMIVTGELNISDANIDIAAPRDAHRRQRHQLRRPRLGPATERIGRHRLQRHV